MKRASCSLVRFETRAVAKKACSCLFLMSFKDVTEIVEEN